MYKKYKKILLSKLAERKKTRPDLFSKIKNHYGS